MRSRIIALSQVLHSSSLDLHLYLIPLPGEIDCSLKLSDFKTWLSTIQEVWHCSTNNILSSLRNYEAQNEPGTATDRQETRREAGSASP
ncbi:hypothetical protein KEM48_001821 [Puccinia striiformis f. sp. tritici PST-130]|nr:hypothetical protein KEM48_001821 [Puccinia striiformis f. sp. tritici PST-130]